MKYTRSNFPFGYFSILSIFMFIIYPSAVNGQTDTKKLDLGDANSASFFRCGDSGLIIKTFKGKSKYGLMHVSTYGNSDNPPGGSGAELDYISLGSGDDWHYTSSSKEYENEDFYVHSDKTEYLYWMSSAMDKNDAKNFRSANRLISIHRFNKEGECEKFKTEIREVDRAVELLHVFSDKENLFYFSVKPAEFKKKTMVSPEVIYLYKMPHNGKKFARTIIDIDLSKEGQVGFVGATDSLIYLCQKRLDLKTNKMEVEIFGLNKMGKEVMKFTIEPDIKNYYSPALYSNKWNGEYDNQKSYNAGYDGRAYLANTNSYRNSLINVTLDDKYNRFCIYALTVKENYQEGFLNKGPMETILLWTYSLTGSSISKANFKMEGNEVFNPKLNKQGRLDARRIEFTTLSENVFRMDIRDVVGPNKVFYISPNKILSSINRDYEFEGYYKFNYCSIEPKKLNLTNPDVYTTKSFGDYLKKNEDLDLNHFEYYVLEYPSQIIFLKIPYRGDEHTVEMMRFD